MLCIQVSSHVHACVESFLHLYFSEKYSVQVGCRDFSEQRVYRAKFKPERIDEIYKEYDCDTEVLETVLCDAFDVGNSFCSTVELGLECIDSTVENRSDLFQSPSGSGLRSFRLIAKPPFFLYNS
jgi:hypothetical protein